MHTTFASALRQLAVATCASLLLAGAAHAAAINADTKPEAGTFKMGMQPWLGYGQWYVAEQAGAFKANGLEQVELVNFTEDKDMNAALASGQIDGGNLATHTAMAMVAAGLPVKIVLLLDQSTSADALIVDPSIKTLTDLKGKQVAYEEGTTSDILLHSALRKAGLTIADVQPVPMPAANAGSALIAGQVPAAVTYEPYLSAAKQQNPKVNLLYKGSDDPGIISDVFVVRDEVLKERPGQVLALIKSWEAGLKHYNEKGAEGRAAIAKGVGADESELTSAFDGVHFYSVKENQAELKGAFQKGSFEHIQKAASEAGILQQPVTPAQAIDARFVEAL
ncbi:ABC transporter substrate-binding protein [Pseudomonas sp. PDM20]|uniref:ABC transporter substrate-binding protein n=1 Tax=Pseudomonas sp. PDM20 TaxID=2769254 RepID=UPI0017850506|nr:ABC transporter substrate-binding protein [Pseudomonas sp. PDM20]MBD9686349.1 ABC transporter substrate-binding protein [Pseudomonas sp. PDM20]